MENKTAAPQPSRPNAGEYDFHYLHARTRPSLVAFAKEIEALGEEIKTSVGPEDFRHLKKFERWGRVATLLGFGTAWILPNPLSAYLIGLGNYVRWSLVFHPISHGAMDRVPNISPRYTSKRFAVGKRRLLDWFDWISPGNWHIEHNIMHHFHLGTENDPDIVARNTRHIRELRAPLAIRYMLALLVVSVWKPFYYAPNTIAEARFQRGESASNKIGWRHWSLSAAEGRELWLRSLLPYAFFKFIFIPSLFFPLGKTAVIAVLINSALGEIIANFHSFAMIGPNHTGDDIHTFTDSAKGRGDFYLRQIIGTVNFPSGGDAADFFYGGMNYQIEHHLWPEASVYQCKKIRPKLQLLCQKYDVPYRESPMLPRLKKTLSAMAGS